MRLSLLGLDGLPPWLLRRAAERLGLSEMSRALRSGSLIPTESMPPITPVAWTSIATGVNPAKHGVWGFTRYYRGPDGRHLSRPYTGADVKFPRVFEDAALKGLQVAVINYPLTWPVKALCCLDQMVVVGDTFLAPRVDFWPQGMASELGRFFLTPADLGDPYRRTELLVEGTMRVLSNYDVDAYFVVLPFPDQAFHKDPYEVLEVGKRSSSVWESIDALVGELMRRSRAFMLVSDHGIATYDRCVNPLSPLMTEFGVGLPKSIKGMMALGLVTLLDRASLHMPRGLSPRELIRRGPLRRLRDALGGYLGAIARPGAFGGSGESELASQPFTYDAGGLSIGRIIYFYNEAARSRGLEALSRSRAGGLVRAAPLEEVFRGAYLPPYPAIFLESADEDRYHIVSTRSLAELRRDPMPDHHVIGTTLIVGADVAASRASVYDVAPTALSLLGLPSPRGADGVSLVGEVGRYPYDVAVRLRARLSAAT